MNTETSRDTRVYFTIAIDLVITGIREPVRFVFEAKAKISSDKSGDKFWYHIPSSFAISSRGKPFQEQFHVHMKEKANSEPDSRYEVISCYSTTQLANKRHKLALKLKDQNSDLSSQRSSSVSSLPTPSTDEPDADEEDNDEPLPSGTGQVSKDVSQTELEGDKLKIILFYLKFFIHLYFRLV